MFQFPPTNRNKPTVLLLLPLFTFAAILNVTLTIPSSNQDTLANYRYFGPAYSFGYPQTPSVHEMFPSRSQLECAMNTLKNQTPFFSYDKVRQLCKTYPVNIMLTASNPNNSSERSFYIRNQWIKVYSISEGVYSSVYRSFLNIGPRSLWNVDYCSGLYCPHFFRHSILDVWEQIPIHEVKLVLYKNKSAVVTMVFNGRSTTLENWFTPKNLKSSPWTDLPTAKPNYFSIDGYMYRRRFYVSDTHGLCVGDTGWLLINEAFLICYYEVFLSYPKFMYSKKSIKTNWNNDFGVADTLAIFIRLM